MLREGVGVIYYHSLYESKCLPSQERHICTIFRPCPNYLEPYWSIAQVPRWDIWNLIHDGQIIGGWGTWAFQGLPICKILCLPVDFPNIPVGIWSKVFSDCHHHSICGSLYQHCFNLVISYKIWRRGRRYISPCVFSPSYSSTNNYVSVDVY